MILKLDDPANYIYVTNDAASSAVKPDGMWFRNGREP